MALLQRLCDCAWSLKSAMARDLLQQRLVSATVDLLIQLTLTSMNAVLALGVLLFVIGIQ